MDLTPSKSTWILTVFPIENGEVHPVKSAKGGSEAAFHRVKKAPAMDDQLKANAPKAHKESGTG